MATDGRARQRPVARPADALRRRLARRGQGQQLYLQPPEAAPEIHHPHRFAEPPHPGDEEFQVVVIEREHAIAEQVVELFVPITGTHHNFR